MQYRIKKTNRNLLVALAIGLAYHGVLLFYTFKRTYDAYVHIFFADHYARAWFDHWEYRWYTGFTMTSYPPGSHQTIALLSKIIGLQNGFIIAQTAAILLVILGIYRFSKIWVSEEAAGYAALLAVFSSSLTETMHVFGQLPTTFSLAFLLNALPFVHAWLRDGQLRNLLLAWALNAATTAGHHVTTLFGAVFFVAPVMALAIVTALFNPLTNEIPPNPSVITRRNLRPILIRYSRRIAPPVIRSGIYGVGLIIILILVVLPYWLWSSSDPITQVSIPHASRDSFIENTAASLVFWLVPWGLMLLILPYAIYKGLTTKAWPMTLSLLLLFVLGTGGTTPIPKLLLRGAFDILTLDRFTFWATILVLPLAGEFIVSLRHGRLGIYLVDQFGSLTRLTILIGLALGMILVSLFVSNLTQFRRFQPEAIDMQPIVNFIEKDEHWRWRYLTLGFGDQMAWLAAQTSATSVDGNYHSARRLPELTTTPIERLEGAKFRGIPGIGSLQQFLTVPDKYNLKFVFSNDQFYDPLLFFSGWHRLGRLENGIMVWEREDIPPLPEVLPRREIPLYQRAMWGIVPIIALTFGLLALIIAFFRIHISNYLGPAARFRPRIGQRIIGQIAARTRAWGQLPAEDNSAPIRWQPLLQRIRNFTLPAPVPPRARYIRIGLLLGIILLIGSFAFARWQQKARSPEAIIEAYYDDLDFRRFGAAYARLDPVERPDFDQYQLELSVDGGLLASYAKLDNIVVERLAVEDDYVEIAAHTDWVTALKRYPTTQLHRLIMRDGVWTIAPPESDISVPPDQFLRQGIVSYFKQGRRQVTTETTAFGDVQDRPELEILSARLVKHEGQLSVVGELVNTDVDPADITVTAFLFDLSGQPLTWYNAQVGVLHKLLPKEVTPFRIDFEGVAGESVNDAQTAADFDPAAFSPLEIPQTVAAFEVYAKGVVTGRDLHRDVGVQQVKFIASQDSNEIHGELINNGTVEAIIPHMLLTYYDDQGDVAWVDDFYLEKAIRPQRVQPFIVPITTFEAIETILQRGDAFANALTNRESAMAFEDVLIPLPEETGYASMRITVHYFVGEGV